MDNLIQENKNLMREDLKKSFAEVLKVTLGIVKKRGTETYDYIKVQRIDQRTCKWVIEKRSRPNMIGLRFEEQVLQPLIKDLRKCFPWYGTSVGTPETGHFRIDAAYLLRIALNNLLEQFNSCSIESTQLDEFIQRFLDSFEQPTIELKIVAPIVNLTLSGASTVLAEDQWQIRQMTDDELTELYGRRIVLPGSMGDFSVQRCAFITKINTRVTTTNDAGPLPSEPFVELNQMLQRIELAFRTFKSGPIGIQGQWISSTDNNPLIPGTTSRRHLDYIPLGAYELCPDEVHDFLKHYRLLKAVHHPALEMACQRLAIAGVRSDPRDKIIDSAIGMEAILLGGKDQGELRYRFSMNYASLFEKPEERMEKFREARDIYDIRSKLVHGSELSDISIGKRKFSLKDAALHVTETLRSLVKRLLRDSNPNLYFGDDYWKSRILGLSQQSQELRVSNDMVDQCGDPAGFPADK